MDPSILTLCLLLKHLVALVRGELASHFTVTGQEIILNTSNYVGFKRKDVFITNAVLCNPLKNGNNRRPTTKEISNCIPFLENLISIIAPKIISTVGGVGLQAINRIFETRYKLSDVVAKPLPIGKFILFPLYHPSPRVIHTKRSLDQQKKDFKKLLNNLPLSSQLRIPKEQSQNN